MLNKYINIISIITLALGCNLIGQDAQAPLENSSKATEAVIVGPEIVEPEIIEAQALDTDPWFPYITRPTKEYAEENKLYPEAILSKIPEFTYVHSSLVPWTFPPLAKEETFSLGSIIADKYVDTKNNKVYNLMYHGTTSDLLDVFNKGASAIRFDVATNKRLGMGFYLTANMNEAKEYACDRLRQRKGYNKDLKAMLLVIGIEDNDKVKGKGVQTTFLSNNQTGQPIDPDLFFMRNVDLAGDLKYRYNQFNFFSNSAPYMKILKIILLPLGFGKTYGLNDLDGLEKGDPKINNDNYLCN
jgi:hypothetical protein